MKKVLYIICLFSSVNFLLSCEEALDQNVEGTLTINEATNTENGLISLLNSSYSALSSGGAYGNSIILATELASDNGWTTRIEILKNFQADPSFPQINGIWRTHYSGIARANLVLANIDNVEFQNNNLPSYIRGQVLFLRALFYFNLVRFYGDVPLITKEIEKPEDAAIPRSSVSEAYDQIKSDLIEAKSLLPDNYNGSGIGLEKGRATKGSATALLAKVYLTVEEWQNAANEAGEIIDSGIYALNQDYSKNFQGNNENGVESVFEVQFSDQADASVGSSLSDFLASPLIVQGNGLSWILPTNDTLGNIGSGVTGNGIVQIFEENDLRKNVAMSTYDLPNQYPLINKYYAGPTAAPNNSPVNVPVLRYAEVLLIYAEASNELGTLNPAAQKAINEVRERAGLSPLDNSVTNDKESFRKAIRLERRKELCFESERFFDLNRYGTLATSMAIQGISIDPSKIITNPITDKSQYLYPIPLVELTTNPNTEQNPGY